MEHSVRRWSDGRARSPSQRLLAVAALATLSGTASGQAAKPLAPSPPRTPASWKGTVVGVADGDTITVLRNKEPIKVRLHGVDCPEKKQPFGQKAKQFTSDLVFGKNVTVRVVTIDKYRRTVAEVFIGNRSLNAELLRSGMGWWFRKYSPKDERLEALEAVARTHKRGLWSDLHPLAPWAFRHPDQYGFHGNTKSRVLHAPGCPAFKCVHCTTAFPNVEEAKAAGYHPHEACVNKATKAEGKGDAP